MKRNFKTKFFLYGLLALILFTAILFLVTFPKIKTSIKESSIQSLIQNHLSSKELQSSALKRTIFYTVPTNGGKSFNFVSYQITLNSLSLPNHQLIEKVITTPIDEALKEGVISIFPKGTKLIGLTLSNQIAFVDFSKEFTIKNSWDEDLSVRIALIRKNLINQTTIRDVVILIEGEIFDKL